MGVGKNAKLGVNEGYHPCLSLMMISSGSKKRSKHLQFLILPGAFPGNDQPRGAGDFSLVEERFFLHQPC